MSTLASMDRLSVVTANLNGVRAAARKGFFEWMAVYQPDVVCVQETKAQMAALQDAGLRPQGYHAYFADAEKKGYSGVGLYTKIQPDDVVDQLGFDLADQEGRYLHVDLGPLRVVSLYLPSGTSGDARQAEKYRMMDYLDEHHFQADHLRAQPAIWAGDWNIAHREIDLKNWRSNRKNSGFLPEERAWLDACLTQERFTDAFRHLYPDREAYTWWSYRARARENNVGWRIDYQMVTHHLRSCLEDAMIINEINVSDHAPLWVQYDLRDLMS